ncbi:MAG: helix-turn-helix domain-containing protein [Akkermansiaceae bacterium]
MILDRRFASDRLGCERLHSHDYAVVVAVVGGVIDLRIADELVCLKRGSICFIELGFTHQILGTSEDFSGVHVLSLACSFLLSSGVKPSSGVVVHDVELHGRFIKWMEAERKEDVCGDAILPVLEECGVRLISLENGGVDESSHWVARRIKALLDDGGDAEACFGFISEQMPFSKEHCNRVFKKFYGITIQAYSLNVRADRARVLLKSGMSISDVALVAGFYDQSQFSKVFRSIYQMTPGEYQRQVVGES